MPVAIDTTHMDIDHDTSSSVKRESSRSNSMKSDSTQPSPVDKPDFPIEKDNMKQVHISPFARFLKQEQEGVSQLQDAVAVTLFNSSPEILMAFLDPMVPSFKAIFKGDKQLVIWRKGNAAFIGIFEHHTSMKVFGFEHLVGFAIGYDGSWHIIKGAGNAFCEPKWPEVWTGKYRYFGGVNKMVAEYEDMEVEKAQRASMMATRLLEGKFWEAVTDVKAT